METKLIFTSKTEDDEDDLKTLLFAREMHSCLCSVKNAIDTRIRHGVYTDREYNFLMYLDDIVRVDGLEIS